MLYAHNHDIYKEVNYTHIHQANIFNTIFDIRTGQKYLWGCQVSINTINSQLPPKVYANKIKWQQPTDFKITKIQYIYRYPLCYRPPTILYQHQAFPNPLDMRSIHLCILYQEMFKGYVTNQTH